MIQNIKLSNLKFFVVVIFICNIYFSLANNLELLTKVERYFNTINTLYSEFKQETLFDTQQILVGKLYIVKPGILRFDYLHPKMTIIVKNHYIMYRDYELDEVSYTKERNYLFYLLSKKNINLHNEIKRISLKNNKINLEIEKIVDDINIKIVMTLTYDPMSLQRITINENNLEKYIFTFTSTRYNIYLDKRLFSVQNQQFYSIPYYYDNKN